MRGSALLRQATNLLGRFLHRCHIPVYVRDGMASVHDHSFLREERFLSAYARGLRSCGGTDYELPWRLKVALWCGRQAIQVPGDFVECGVNRGFMSSALMHDLAWEHCGRTFWLIDSFSGIDIDQLTPDEKARGRAGYNRTALKRGFYENDPAAVRDNFREWPSARVVQGVLPDCLSALVLGRVAFVHMDLNSVRAEIQTLEVLWPQISGGGVVLVDDYGFFGFAAHKPAYDTFAKERGIDVLQLPTGQGVLVKPVA